MHVFTLKMNPNYINNNNENIAFSKNIDNGFCQMIIIDSNTCIGDVSNIGLPNGHELFEYLRLQMVSYIV